MRLVQHTAQEKAVIKPEHYFSKLSFPGPVFPLISDKDYDMLHESCGKRVDYKSLIIDFLGPWDVRWV